MTYIDQINLFWITARNVKFSPNEAFLYFFLLNECNTRNWENPFACPNRLIVMSTGMSEPTLIDCRNRLQTKGLIKFESGKRNGKSPKYYLKNLSRDLNNLSGNLKNLSGDLNNLSKDFSKTFSKTFSKKNDNELSNNTLQNIENKKTEKVVENSESVEKEKREKETKEKQETKKVHKEEIEEKDKREKYKREKVPIGNADFEKSAIVQPTEKIDSVNEEEEKEKDSAEKENLNYSARKIFEKYYRSITGEEYYFAAKDAGNLNHILQKFKYLLTKKGKEGNDKELLVAFEYLLNSIHDDWVMENLSIPIINSKFNELIKQARNEATSKNNGTARSSGSEWASKENISKAVAVGYALANAGNDR